MTDRDDFDPYRKWLGIPPKDQPPNHYRLLGIELFEHDPDVIESAADARMAHLRTFQTGKRAELSQKILTELASARGCLLDADRKSEYDKQLKAELAVKQPPAARPSARPAARPAVVAPAVQRPNPRTAPGPRSASLPGESNNADGASPSGIGVAAPAQRRPVAAGAAAQGAAPVVSNSAGAAAAPVAARGRRGAARKRSNNMLPHILTGVAALGIVVVLTLMAFRKEAEPPEPNEVAGKNGAAATTQTQPQTNRPGGNENGGSSKPDLPDRSDEIDDLIEGLPSFDDRLAPPEDKRSLSDGPLPLASLQEFDRLVVAGKWEANAEENYILGHAAADETAMLEIPKTLPENYEITMIVTRQDGSGTFGMTLPLGERRVRIVLDRITADGAFASGLLDRDGEMRLAAEYAAPLLVPGAAVPLRIVVVDGSVYVEAYGGLVSRSRPRGFGGRPFGGGSGGRGGGSRDATVSESRLALLVTNAAVRLDKPQLALLATPSHYRPPAPYVPGAEPTEPPVAPEPPVVADGNGDDPDRRHPKPSGGELAQASQEVQRMFKDRFEAAKTAEERLLLAREALELAATTKNDPAGVYALLNFARGAATNDGHVALAAEAVEKIVAAYEVDPLEERVACFLKITRNAADTDSRLALANQAAELIDPLVDRDDFDRAILVLDAGALHAQQARELDRAKALRQRKPQLEQWQQKYQALLALRAEHGESDSRYLGALGEFCCFDREQWERGLPLLADHAENDALRALARDDRTEPAEPQAQVALADRWWDYAEQSSEAARDALRRRAGVWYKRALPGLEGLPRTRVEQQLAALVSTAPVGPALAAPRFRAYEVRKAQNRKQLLDYYGGSEQTEAAVEQALRWLAGAQRADGSWRSDRGEESPNFDTGEILGVYLAGGYSHQAGAHNETVQKGLAFLTTRIQTAPYGGSLHDRATGMSSHAVATNAICEALGLTRQRQLTPHAQNTLNSIFALQNSQTGGWALNPREDNGNLLTTLWALRAVRSADLAGQKIPPDVYNKAKNFLDAMMYDDGAGYALVVRDGNRQGRDELTLAAGVLARMYAGAPRTNPALVRGIEELAKLGPQKNNALFNYIATQAMFHYGGQKWRAWNEALVPLVLEARTTEGEHPGTWLSAEDAALGSTNRLGQTALNAAALQTYYREPPIFSIAPNEP